MSSSRRSWYERIVRYFRVGSLPLLMRNIFLVNAVILFALMFIASICVAVLVSGVAVYSVFLSIAVVLLFHGMTALVTWLVALLRVPIDHAKALVIMLSWILKIVFFVVLFMALGNIVWIHRIVFGITLAIAVIICSINYIIAGKVNRII